jgi:hypothetical protein
MNKRSVKVKRPAAKASPGRVQSKAVSRRTPVTPLKLEPSVNAAPITVPPVAHHAAAARSAVLRSHKFRVGQTVLYTSSPITRPGASGTYKVVKLLPSDGDDYQYRIKNAGEAFERVAKESQLELEH